MIWSNDSEHDLNHDFEFDFLNYLDLHLSGPLNNFWLNFLACFHSRKYKFLDILLSSKFAIFSLANYDFFCKFGDQIIIIALCISLLRSEHHDRKTATFGTFLSILLWKDTLNFQADNMAPFCKISSLYLLKKYQ